MVVLLLSVLLALSPPDSTETLEACLSIGPKRAPPAVTSLNEAQRSWLDDPSVPRDTLRAHLSRILQARRCYKDLNPAHVERPFIGNVLETYEAEAELRAALRQFPKAFDAYREGLSYLRSQSSNGHVGYEEAQATWPFFLHQEQGYLHYVRGNLSASIEQYLKAYETTPSSESGRQVQFLIDVGILHQRMQDYRSARQYFTRAERLFRASNLSPDTHPTQRSRLLSLRADLLLEQTMNSTFDRQALERARRLADRALALVESGTERHARASIVLSESLGYLEVFDRAYRLNEDVQRYARTHGDARLQTVAHLKLGILHVLSGRRRAADTILSRALEMAEGLGDLDYQRRVLEALGRLHELQEEWSAAESYYRKGVAVVDRYRESLTASQWSMSALSEWQTVHRGLVRSLLAQNRHRDALRALDRTRARHLQDLRTEARVVDQFSSQKRARLDSLSRALVAVRNQLGQASLSPNRETTLRNRETSLMAARQQLLDVPSATDRPSIDAISHALKARDRALVSYFIDDPWPVYGRRPRSAAFVLTGDTLRVASLGAVTQDSVRSQIEATSSVFVEGVQGDKANAMHFDLRPLHRLQETLYAPITNHLPDRQSLTIVPDGPLFRLPFSMLVRAMPGGRYSPGEARFVVHERPTSVELASSLVAETTRTGGLTRPSARAELAAFGIAEFDTLTSVPTALRSGVPGAALDSSLALPSLPGVKKEIEAVREQVGTASVTMGAAATETAVQNTMRQAGVLHVASHAFVHPFSPLHNAVLLRPDSAVGSDGVLFLHELTARRDQLSLVVLSGCSTARGLLQGGEGMEGLQYAFRATGARSTVSTLWPVADDANAELMEAFYRYLRAGRTKASALRHARLDFLQDHPDRASPFFWAPTVLYGDPTPLNIAGASPVPSWARWGLGLTGLLLAALLIWWGLLTQLASVWGRGST